MKDWRTIEAAVIAVAKDYGYGVDESSLSGDKLVDVLDDDGAVIHSFNATLLAQALAERIDIAPRAIQVKA